MSKGFSVEVQIKESFRTLVEVSLLYTRWKVGGSSEPRLVRDGGTRGRSSFRVSVLLPFTPRGLVTKSDHVAPFHSCLIGTVSDTSYVKSRVKVEERTVRSEFLVTKK